jgi:hypothetical protein
MLDLPDLLSRFDRPAHQFVESSRGLRLRRPRLTDAATRASVSRHAAALRIARRLDLIDPLDGPARRRAWRVDEWGLETALHARWLAHLFSFPVGGVTLRPGIRVTDAERFRTSVAERYAAGPAAPYADGLRRDLASLFAQYALVPAVGQRQAPALARAA